MPETKHIAAKLEFKDDGTDQTLGLVSAAFSVFNEKDSDGDVVLPSFFTDGQTVPMASWGHAWGDLPPGRGVIKVDPDRAVFEGRFFLNTTQGRDHYYTLRETSDIQEWSFGFRVLEAEQGDFGGDPVRFLKRGEIFEVSPVLVGANRNTSTLAIKSAQADEPKSDEPKAAEPQAADPEPPETKAAVAGSFEERAELLSVALQGRYGGGMDTDTQDTMTWAYAVATFSDRVVVCIMGGGEEDYREVEYSLSDGVVTLGADRPVDLQTTIVPKGLDFPDHSERVRIAVQGWVARAQAGSALRQKEGRAISEARRSRMATVRDQLRVGADEIDGMLAETEPKPKAADPAIRAEFLRYQRLRARQLVGV